jgi:hypothetical protein
VSVPRSFRRAAAARGSVVIRRAVEGDDAVLERLAALSDRPLPCGPFLLAESDGEPLAARSLATGAVLVDPFRVSYDLVALLDLRARHLGDAA